jgi:hypothetical protein
MTKQAPKSDEEKVLSKIAKLLRLHAQTDKPGEAEASLLAAQRLMARHKISEQQATDEAMKDPEAEEIIVEMVDRTGQRVEWRKELLKVIAKNFRIKWFREYPVIGHKRYIELKVYGTREDVEIAKEVYVAARNHCEALVRNYLDRNRPAYLPLGEATSWGLRERATWIGGFTKGLAEAFTRQVTDNDWALIVVPPEAVIRYGHETLRLVNSGFQTTARTDQGSQQAHQAGRAAGMKFGQNATGFNKTDKLSG